jgi:hypothetical protein
MADRTEHDQLIKSLIKKFFKQYMELFFPELAKRLYLDSPDFPVEFQPQEFFTDIPRGSRREVDILARVWTIDQRFETILIHTESQEDDRQDPDKKKLPFLDRMFCYSLMLQGRYFPEHVIPVVLWFAPKKGGVGVETYDYKALGAGLTMTYYHVCIPDLDAEEYLSKDNPLAYALAARMGRGKLSRMRLALACRTKIFRAPLNEVERTVLLDFLDTYAKLNGKEQKEMQAILDNEPEYTDVKRSELTWLSKQRAAAAAQTAAQSVLTVLAVRGITVSDAAQKQILECTDMRLLTAWLKRAVVAPSIDEVMQPTV